MIDRSSEVETNSLLAPRSVPATSSCSAATPSTSPIGDSRRPAVERTVTGVATDGIDTVAVDVLVGNEREVGLIAVDRGAVRAQAVVEHERHVPEGVRRRRRESAGQAK